MEMTNDTLLVLFKNLNKLGSKNSLGPENLELYNNLKKELEKRLDKTLPPWNYKLYPFGITKDLVDWEYVNKIIDNV